MTGLNSKIISIEYPGGGARGEEMYRLSILAVCGVFLFFFFYKILHAD